MDFNGGLPRVHHRHHGSYHRHRLLLLGSYYSHRLHYGWTRRAHWNFAPKTRCLH